MPSAANIPTVLKPSRRGLVGHVARLRVVRNAYKRFSREMVRDLAVDGRYKKYCFEKFNLSMWSGLSWRIGRSSGIW